MIAVSEWLAVASLDDLWEGEMTAVEVEGHRVLVLRVDGGDVHAYQGVCPHQDQQLVDGDFDGRALVCHGHLWEFDATTGQGVNPAECSLARYPIKVEDGTVYVSVRGVTPEHWQ